MLPRIYHIYGPLWINGYGMMIALGFVVFAFLFFHDKKVKALFSDEQILNLFLLGFIAAVIGGRLFAIITDFSFYKGNLWEIFYPWVGGFGVLGSIIAVILTFYFYFSYLKVPILKSFDRIALYIPILHAIARVGCFFAGCCYGRVTDSWVGVVCHRIDSLIPSDLLCVPLHPTQLYSSFAAFLYFLFGYFVLQKIFDKEGQLLFSYLMFQSLSRFFVDFYRGDFLFFVFGISFVQLLSLIIFVIALIGFTYVSFFRKA